MPDCPHIHVQDSGLQAFREIIREETGNGQTIARFLNDAVEGRLPNFQPQHRLEAANPTYIFTEPRVGYRMPKGESPEPEVS